MMMSIIYPDSGSIQVLDSTALEAKDRIGYLPEERGLYRKMKIHQFLRYIAKLKEVDRHDIDRRINWWLERLELPDVLNRRCEALSKGQQQKLQFIASVVHDPELIILDEPFSGLDPVNASLLSDIIQELREQGRTIIFSTHVLHQAERLCDRVFLINKGVKLLDDPIEDIRERHNPRVIAMELLEPSNQEIIPVDGVREAKASDDGVKFDLHLNHDADARSIMSTLTSHYDIRAIEIRQPTLDDIFVELVQGGSDS
jgi:ABC-2 type transport system ATP-binding protein